MWLYWFLVDLELLLECQKMQASVLHRHNKKMAATNDALAQMYASQGNNQNGKTKVDKIRVVPNVFRWLSALVLIFGAELFSCGCSLRETEHRVCQWDAQTGLCVLQLVSFMMELMMTSLFDLSWPLTLYCCKIFKVQQIVHKLWIYSSLQVKSCYSHEGKMCKGSAQVRL